MSVEFGHSQGKERIVCSGCGRRQLPNFPGGQRSEVPTEYMVHEDPENIPKPTWSSSQTDPVYEKSVRGIISLYTPVGCRERSSVIDAGKLL